ncbi:uncharacterized protein A1O9_04698 [Exophiala aquamarina CBS 119918]|uniref:DNA helicase n=1 Tax=Exophiala aquamarina CBS 119918 TaxID=1182545 RepID=A0A072PWA4_9EURO|nr:uncharacterized protein A1O9_04698 [Exophiala aquamarina CBS 119918]KEF59850.1 hypothetical protein A1O9_04698 [Exophiala aquamarina CBS 119918]
MASEDSLMLSDDELFNPVVKPQHETIETLPLHRPTIDDYDDSDYETLATLPLDHSVLNNGRSTSGGQTQPTQLIPRLSSPDMPSSPPKLPTVQVAASSPVIGSSAMPKQRGILASAMAPAGTTFRLPTIAVPQRRPEPITIDSDDEGPTYRGGSSDDDEGSSRKNDLKTYTFSRKPQPEKVAESPQGQSDGSSRFSKIASSYMYRASSNSSLASSSTKRSADTNANAYGNATKKPRQAGPARALPVQKKIPEMDMDDISDYNTRQKVKRLLAMVRGVSVLESFTVLQNKKGNYDDAVEQLLTLSEKRESDGKKNAIDLISDDELTLTPGVPKRPLLHVPKQHPKAPQKTIVEKWGSTQIPKKPQKVISVFDTPQPRPKKRTLIRGRRRSSTPPAPLPTKPLPRAVQTIQSDDSDEADSAANSDAEANPTFQSRVLEFFNKCSAADLVDTASTSKELAQFFVSQRPFKSLDAITEIQDPSLKPTKGRRKTAPIGERLVEKVEAMLESYDAVDFLVQRCQNLAKPLATEMKRWGINMHGSQSGELEMVSLHEVQKTHDSGIGTPVSDEDPDNVRQPGSRNRIGQPSSMSPDIQMKDYQIAGVNWLNLLYKRNLSCILADDMGLGKTCQVIAFLAHLFEEGHAGPHLVVVPAATLENWLKEFKRFCPTLRVEPYYSTVPGERMMLRQTFEDSKEEVNVIVTTYTIAKARDDFPWLRTFGFDCTVFDEGHVLKNADSQVASKLVKIASNFRLLLTGTPLQNNLKELISLLAFLMPDVFKDKQSALRTIFSHTVKAMDGNHDALLSAQRITRARSMLTPFILRRKKYQVLEDLPKKERRVELCDMTAEQVEIYQLWLEKAYSIRERREKGENMGQESSNILMKLRQAAIHPFLFRRLYPDKILPKIAKQCLRVEMWRESNPDLIVTELKAYSDMEINTLCDAHEELKRFVLVNNEWMASGKVEKTVELLRKFMSEGHRTLIFSQFTMVLDILELVLQHEDIGYYRLDGTTRVSERQDMIDEFSADDNKTPVFMLSTKAGGAGINLATANKVIVFDSGFNPQDDIQAENRAHRIGQTKEVEVIRLVSRGSVEEQIHAMGLAKLKLDEQVAGDGAEEQPPQNGAEETEKEAEGRQLVESMFFAKLNQEPIDQLKAEVASPAKAKLPKSEEPAPELKPNDVELEKYPDASQNRQASVDLPARPRRSKRA